MEVENQKSRTGRFRNWFTRKHDQRDNPSHNLDGDGDGDGDEGDYYMDDLYVQSFEIDPCILTNELRIFVGTWNVAGRYPVGSLAVDLDEWLNLKEEADMYILGFQEIVPLKTLTVIGAEDPTVATSWNLLIGETLNKKYGNPRLTPMLNPISDDNYQYMVPNSEGRMTIGSHSGTPMTKRSKTLHEKLIEGSKYKLMASKKMVGVFISVWMKKELIRKYCISNVKVCSVACGIMGYLGNKGSVSVSLSVEGTSFCFLVAHLASGEKKGDEGRRNYQVSEIFRRTAFSRTPKDDTSTHPLTILGHDRIFWFGDLNYRLYLEDNFARQLIEKQNWSALQGFDQLRKEQEESGVFEGWKEGNIEFAPTYKYSSSNGNRYSGGLPSRSGEKQRTPAWCDRILWYGKGVKQISYFRSESKFSDHRPVSAQFSTQIEIKPSNPIGVASHNITPTMVAPKTGTDKGDHEEKPTLLSLMVKDIDAWKHAELVLK
ncbi:Type I inositol polyphosphate 5-phosphatase [Quillaja saponaria]|uniref:Type I inositol polyphosphate 5-phosphatase n=1 Tax=Quillaja saponaria TaxID=32244 RepID=A0AAD7PXD4_QUISA|nr:Type I inositol polyphosphate 5-phosphatase [Quillaja saponaria]